MVFHGLFGSLGDIFFKTIYFDMVLA